jgi:hypothetical protein
MEAQRELRGKLEQALEAQAAFGVLAGATTARFRAVMAEAAYRLLASLASLCGRASRSPW